MNSGKLRGTKMALEALVKNVVLLNENPKHTPHHHLRNGVLNATKRRQAIPSINIAMRKMVFEPFVKNVLMKGMPVAFTIYLFIYLFIQSDRFASFESCLRSLLRNARKRKDKFDNLTIEMLYDFWKKQNGLCYYSGIPMVIGRKKDWQVSLERLDPNGKYNEHNCALVCLEFNGVKQMSIQKVK